MPIELVLSLAALFISVAAGVAMMTARFLADRGPGHERIRRVIEGGDSSLVLPPVLSVAAPRQPGKLHALVPKSPKELERLRVRFARAGYHWIGAPVALSVCEIVAPILLAAPVWLILGNGPVGWISAALAAVAGFIAPGLWLERQVESRKGRIRDGLPDTLDLLVVCLEAGCSIDQAILRAATELAITHPDVSEELHTILVEARAGKSRVDSFRGFAERTKLEEARALVSMLVQTDRFGTSVAQALRAHAESARNARRQRAEERAAKLAVKLVFPLVLFLFPALYVVLLGPAVIEYLRLFNR